MVAGSIAVVSMTRISHQYLIKQMDVGKVGVQEYVSYKCFSSKCRDPVICYYRSIKPWLAGLCKKPPNMMQDELRRQKMGRYGFDGRFLKPALRPLSNRSRGSLRTKRNKKEKKRTRKQEHKNRASNMNVHMQYLIYRSAYLPPRTQPKINCWFWFFASNAPGSLSIMGVLIIQRGFKKGLMIDMKFYLLQGGVTLVKQAGCCNAPRGSGASSSHIIPVAS